VNRHVKTFGQARITALLPRAKPSANQNGLGRSSPRTASSLLAASRPHLPDDRNLSSQWPYSAGTPEHNAVAASQDRYMPLRALRAIAAAQIVQRYERPVVKSPVSAKWKDDLAYTLEPPCRPTCGMDQASTARFLNFLQLLWPRRDLSRDHIPRRAICLLALLYQGSV